MDLESVIRDVTQTEKVSPAHVILAYNEYMDLCKWYKWGWSLKMEKGLQEAVKSGDGEGKNVEK